jgi:Phosphorylated adapter RNA export protein, RNA-binding domain
MEELTVETLAEVLQETNRPLLMQILQILGPDRTSTLLIETLQCEAAGGMLTKDGTRRRTPGGTFFQLVRQQAQPHERRRLFPQLAPQQGRTQPQRQPTVLTWEEASTLLQTLATQPPGEARTMKLTLIGRPGKVETRGQAVLFRMQGKPPGALPRGLPPVPSTAPLTWNVMVALRQWNRVKDSVTGNPDDQLIIEGYPLMQGTQLVLMAQSCVSMLQQRAQKQAQRQQETEQTS